MEAMKATAAAVRMGTDGGSCSERVFATSPGRFKES